MPSKNNLGNLAKGNDKTAPILKPGSAKKTAKLKSSVETDQLLLKLPLEIKKDFKAYSAMQGKSMTDMFLEMFAAYKK